MQLFGSRNLIALMHNGIIQALLLKCKLRVLNAIYRSQLVTKSACVPLVVSSVGTFMCICWNFTCSWIVAWHMYRRWFSADSVVAAHCPARSSPTPFPLSFHCFNSVMGACSSYCVGAHGWVTRIFLNELATNSGSSWMSLAPNLCFCDAVDVNSWTNSQSSKDDNNTIMKII